MVFYQKTYLGKPLNRMPGNKMFSFPTGMGSCNWGFLDSKNWYEAVLVEALRRLSREGVASRYNFEKDSLCHIRMTQVRIANVNIRI
jgi:hypothetical protein